MKYPNTYAKNFYLASKSSAVAVSDWSILAGRIVRLLEHTRVFSSEDELWQMIRSTIASHYMKQSEESEYNRTVVGPRPSFRRRALAVDGKEEPIA